MQFLEFGPNGTGHFWLVRDPFRIKNSADSIRILFQNWISLSCPSENLIDNGGLLPLTASNSVNLVHPSGDDGCVTSSLILRFMVVSSREDSSFQEASRFLHGVERVTSWDCRDAAAL